jgi:hypothetical protein
MGVNGERYSRAAVESGANFVVSAGAAGAEKTLIQAAFELASPGPPSANCEPLPLVLARSRQAKERLVPCVSSGNYEKVRTAPISAIVEYDRECFELLPRLYPHSDARGDGGRIFC